MSVEIRTTKDNISWESVEGLLSYFGLSQLDTDTQRQVFLNSYAVAFAYDGERLIGCGRALSDGICQAAIYNIAVNEEYQGQ